jgi:hypothetical protein
MHFPPRVLVYSVDRRGDQLYLAVQCVWVTCHLCLFLGCGLSAADRSEQ